MQALEVMLSHDSFFDCGFAFWNRARKLGMRLGVRGKCLGGRQRVLRDVSVKVCGCKVNCLMPGMKKIPIFEFNDLVFDMCERTSPDILMLI